MELRRIALTLAAIGTLAAGCSEGASAPGEPANEATPDGQTGGELRALTYVSLGDSWPEGAHCNGCRTFPQLHAEALQELLGRPITFKALAGAAQPYFDTPGGGGSSGLLEALRSDDAFRAEVATGDIIVISTGPNDGGEIFEAIQDGTCGGKGDAACVGVLGRTWKREFDAILDEIENLRGGRATAVRLVTAANAFTDPSFSRAALRGFEAYFEALTAAMCETADEHDAVCVDVRPVLSGPDFEQPVNDSSQESMDAVAELLVQSGVAELE